MKGKWSGLATLLALVIAIVALYATMQPEPEGRGSGLPLYQGSFLAPESGNYVKLHDGATFTMYSDGGSTSIFSVDGSGNVSAAGTMASTGASSGISLTVTGPVTANAVVVTTSVSAADLTASDDLIVGDDATITDSLSADDIVVGGGYGSTGCTISNAGVLQCNGAATTGGALTAASAVIGGGFGSTGCSVSDAGVIQCNGAGTFSGVDLDGNTLYVGADQGQYIDELADDVTVWQMGAGTGVVQYLTGNVLVGNGSPTVAQDGEDFYVEGAVEVDGPTLLDNYIDVDGSADAVQLSVAGYTTQTSDLVQFDGGLVDIGGGTYTIANGDNDLGVAGDIEVDNNLNVQGYIANDTGDVTVNDDLNVSNRLIFAYNAMTVTNGLTINPSAVYHQIHAASDVTITLGVATAEQGQIVILLGMDAFGVTITDTNILTSNGLAFVLGQYDTIMFIYDSDLAAWVEISRSVNS